MKLPKSSHTRDPLAAVLILCPGKDTHPLKTPGNLNGTYNTPKQYSMSTSNGEISKRLDCVVRTRGFSSRPSYPFQDCVVQTFAFSSHPSCIKTCHLCPTPPLLVQDPSTVNGSTVSFLLPFLDANATFSMLPSSNSHPLSPN